MRAEVDAGKSHATANNLRALAVAFAEWLTREGRAELAGFGRRVDTFAADLDRRRERRPLTPDELRRLFEVARSRGRLLWYALAYYAGLRRGELGRVTWGDVDTRHRQLRVRNTKSGRLDVIPLHPELARELEVARPLLTPSALATSRIFPRPVSRRTRLLDYRRAAIAEVDDSGRIADLHALRATLCTTLLDHGMAATKVQSMLRHANLATTLKHYHKLSLSSVAEGLAMLPVVESSTLAATGTDCKTGVAIDTSRDTSRLTKPRDSTRRSETVRESTLSTIPTEPLIARELARSCENPRDVVVSFPTTRALSSVG